MIASIIFINIPFIESKTEIIKKSLLYSGLLGLDLCIIKTQSFVNKS